MKKFCLYTIVSIILCVGNAASAKGSAGFCQVTGDVADTSDWSDAGRFASIPFEHASGFCGNIQSTSGSTITVDGAFWTVNEFVFDAATQPLSYYAEVTSGSAAGSRFDIVSNLGNSVTLDLAGGSLSGIAAGDELRVFSKWTLDLLFPDGEGLTASTDSTTGTQVVIPANNSAVLSASPTFVYRSDLGFWINAADPATDAGSQLIERGALMVLVQDSGTLITPTIKGMTVASSPTVYISVNYNEPLESLPEISVEQPVNTSLTDGTSSYDFGSVNSGSVTFTIRNSGGLELNSLAASVTGAHNTDYVAGALSTTTLAPGATTTLTVTFTPSQSGSRTATLQIASNDADENPFDISLTGSAPSVSNPTNLQLSTTSSGSVILNWGAVSGAQNYTIYRSADGTFGNAVAIGSSSSTTYTDSTNSEGVTFSYWVEASNAGNSAVAGFNIFTRYRSLRPLIANRATANYTGDFDNNGIDDLLLQNQSTGEIGWWLMASPGGNIASGNVLSVTPGENWQLVNHADFDNNGAPDLLLRNSESGRIAVWSTEGADINLNNTLALDSDLATGNWKLAGADNNLLVWQNTETGQISRQTVTGMNSGTVYGTTESELFSSQISDPNWQVVGVKDFNGDQSSDILWQNKETGAINAWLLNSSQNLMSAVSIPLQVDSNDWQVRAIGDWDGDSQPDLALQNQSDGTISLWLMDQLSPSSVVEPTQQPQSANWELRNSNQGD